MGSKSKFERLAERGTQKPRTRCVAVPVPVDDGRIRAPRLKEPEGPPEPPRVENENQRAEREARNLERSNARDPENWTEEDQALEREVLYVRQPMPAEVVEVAKLAGLKGIEGFGELPFEEHWKLSVELTLRFVVDPDTGHRVFQEQHRADLNLQPFDTYMLSVSAAAFEMLSTRPDDAKKG